MKPDPMMALAQRRANVLVKAAPRMEALLRRMLERRPILEPPKGGSAHANWLLFQEARYILDEIDQA